MSSTSSSREKSKSKLKAKELFYEAKASIDSPISYVCGWSTSLGVPPTSVGNAVSEGGCIESSVAELKTWFGQMEIPSGRILQGRLILKLSLYFETTYHFNFSRFFPNFCPRLQYSISFSYGLFLLTK